jgi:hypothetical protein
MIKAVSIVSEMGKSVEDADPVSVSPPGPLDCSLPFPFALLLFKSDELL